MRTCGIISHAVSIPALLLASTLLLWTLLPQHAHAEYLSEWAGGPTPLLSLPELSGEKVSLEAFRGRVVVVNFWATWCEPCIAELPSLQALRDRYPEKLAVLAVNLGEPESRIRSFATKTGLRMPLLVDAAGKAKADWKVKAVPETFVVDRGGQIRFSALGEVDFLDEDTIADISSLWSTPTLAKRTPRAKGFNKERAKDTRDPRDTNARASRAVEKRPASSAQKND